MSLTRTKRRRRLKNPEKHITDISLNDFANSDKGVCRKKVGMKKLIEEVKSLALNLETDCAEEEDGPSNNDKGIRKRRRRCSEMGKDASQDAVSEETLPASVYPIDVWFIIGEYIRPEDVGRFAAICTASRAVVASPDFWLRLRRRYLGSNYMAEKNTFALRAQVIRALRQSYPPLISRPQFFIRTQAICSTEGNITSLASGMSLQRNLSGRERLGTKLLNVIAQRRLLRFTGDHHLVLGAYCMQAWQEKRKDNWIYYIKLKQPFQQNGFAVYQNLSFVDNNNELSAAKDDGTPDCWMSRSTGEEIFCSEDEQKKQIGDIWANSEEGCKVIEIMMDKEQLSNSHAGPCPLLGLSLVWACARHASTTCASSNSRCFALLFGPPNLSPKAATSLLSKLSTGWQSCGGGWAEPVSEAEEISLSCGTPLPKGSKCGVVRRDCCKGGAAGSAMTAAKGLAHPEGMVPVVFPGVNSVRLLDWWDADYPYPGEIRNQGERCGDDEDDHGRWVA